ncbi:MAG: ectonucleotide pyrophosphatase/phosphodiesterase [Acidobacteriota bacterium]
MQRTLLCLLILNLIFGISFQSTLAQQRTKAKIPVVLLSIDGMKPDYILEADKLGLKIPNLRRLVKEGAFATGVKGMMPTVTYPSHTTMVTGVAPARHGIYANSPFDPFSKNQGGWMWYAEDIKALTLWEAVNHAGMKSSSVDWPVTVGANITFNIAQIWRASTAEDRKLLRAVSTKGLLTEVEKAVGNYPEGYDYSIKAERQRSAINSYILENKKPNFHTGYFSALDEEQHSHGPYSKETYQTLEELDELIGNVRASAEKAGNGRAYFCVVSDHGFFKLNKEVRLNFALREAGLIELDEKGKLKSWRAIIWNSGATSAVILKDPNDRETKNKVRDILTRLVADEKSGVYKFFEGEELNQTGGFPNAAFIVCTKPEHYISGNFEGPITVGRLPGGGHGFLADFPEMNSAFFIVGPGIQAGKNLGVIDMRDIAPTLASLLGVKLPNAEGRNVLLINRSAKP